MSCDVGKARKSWRMSCDVGEVTGRLENDLDVYLYYAALQNLTYGCGMFHRPLLKAATHHRYTVPNMCSNLSTGPSWLSYLPLDPRFVGSNPARVDGFFQSIKILSMTSFGREVKSWVHVVIYGT